MYNAISSIIDHVWQTNYTSDQQYIYYICGAIIVILSVFVLDLIRSLIQAAAGKR